MPRKQRFKPSRKPKPSPQTEDTMIGHRVGSPTSGRPDIDEDARDGDSETSPTESESDQRSR